MLLANRCARIGRARTRSDEPTRETLENAAATTKEDVEEVLLASQYHHQ